MAKYRIIKKNGKFRIQEKSIFMIWADVLTIGENPVEFDTQPQAEKLIEKWIEQDNEDGKVVKEF